MRDRYQREIRDLRLSVTGHCNYRCVYCRAGAGNGALPAELSWEDLESIARAFVALGIRKIRLTGGEPLLRPGLAEFAVRLRELPLEDVALTTNGHLLAAHAAALRAAGIHRVTISLDSLQADKFARITRVPGSLPHVMAGIEAACAAGLGPVKVNAVLLRGFNDDEIEAFAALARQGQVVVRFIEYMPLGEGQVWSRDLVVPLAEILARLADSYPVVELPRAPSETARRFRFADGAPGEIGIIAPVTEPFCGQCSRIRVTADGKIRTCLFSLREWDLTASLRAPGGAAARQAALEAQILRAVERKEARHHIGEPGFIHPDRGMVQIGG
ncbi:MAG: GTP 3',8-cyclase MoaA [Terriglobales bacterium]